MVNEKSKKNLKPPFKPGESGNPAGKVPGTLSLKRLLREALEKIYKDKSTAADLLIKRLLEKSIVRGDGKMIELVFNYIDGKPKEQVDMNMKSSMEVTLSPEQIEKLNKIIKSVKRK